MAFEYDGEFGANEAYYEPNSKGYSRYDIDQQKKRFAVLENYRLYWILHRLCIINFCAGEFFKTPNATEYKSNYYNWRSITK